MKNYLQNTIALAELHKRIDEIKASSLSFGEKAKAIKVARAEFESNKVR